MKTRCLTVITPFFLLGCLLNDSVANPYDTLEPLGPSSRRGALVISEIMVDAPSAWGGTNSLEFVEIYNSGLITEDLSGHRFTGEIDYTFPDETMLSPGDFIVVAKDPAAAQSFYGISCLGPYDGKLANNGGLLRLRNEIDGILLEVEYNDKAPWPVAAFGTGHSMVLSRPSYGEGDPRAWSASDVIGGSPGGQESLGNEPARGVVINEYLAHTDLPQVDAVELFNTGLDPVDLSGFWLSDAAGTNKYRIADGTTIGARGFLSFDQTQLGFALSADGEQIFLVNAAQTRVIDAVSFRGQANGVSEGRYPDGAPDFQSLSSVTLGNPNTAPRLPAIVINEIMYHPISDSKNDEYVELYNRSGSAVDLSGWRLQGGISYEFPSNTVLAANAYLVVAENATNLIAKYSQLNTANTYGNYGGSLADSGETIRLSMIDDLISTNEFGIVITNMFYIPVDEVSYLDGGRWGDWSDGGGSSLELIDPDADNRYPSNWADSDETAKAEWTVFDVTTNLFNGQGTADRIELYMQGAGEVLIDDLEFRNNGGGNWLNNGNFASGNSGWVFGGVVRQSYVENGAGQDGSAALRLVSTARGDVSCNNADHALTGTASTGGSNTGTIRAKVRWLKGSRHVMIRLRGQWMEVSSPIAVPDDCGTPGQANSQRVANAGPALYDVTHFPVLPAAGEDVVVTARGSDPDGISGLFLSYRDDPGVMDQHLLPMTDDGTGGDAVAGDGIYSATISGQSLGELIAFYVLAVDGGGTAYTTFPAAIPERECLIRWGEPQYASSLGTYRLWMTADNLSFWSSREKNANDTIDATFVYGNSRVVYNVDTMYSGSPFHVGAYNGPLGSFACDYEINFHPDERFLGSKPFVISAEGTTDDFWFDYTTQVDQTATWIGRLLGQQYNYRRHVNLVFNGIRRGLVYLDTQQPNSEMLDEYYPNDEEGDLRKVEDWFEFEVNDVDFSYITATLQQFNEPSGAIDAKRYRWNWRPRTTDDHDDWYAFTNLVAAVNDTGPGYESRAKNWIDIQNFLWPVALNHICGNWDSYGYERGKNMYIYKPDNQGWRMLPWDIELALGNGGRDTNDSIYNIHDPALSAFIQSSPAVHRIYLMAFQEAVDHALLPNVYGPILDERYVSLVVNGVSVSQPTSIKNWLAGRRAYLVSTLPSAIFGVNGSVAFPVTTNSVVLTGSAQLQVADILVNGIAYPLEWTTTTSWRMTVPLTAGLNNLTVTGVDRFGNPVSGADATLAITYTGSNVDPEGVVVISEIHPSPEDRDQQFLEIHNTDPDRVFDLSGWRINGIGYTFPAGSVILPGEYLVLAKDRFGFGARFRDAAVLGEYDGSLDPQGETVTLFRPGAQPDSEIVVDRVRYEAGAPWVSSAGGTSLQLIDPSRDNARVANWGRSVAGEVPDPVHLFDIEHTWKYNDAGANLGTSWRSPGYDDSSWSTGSALLYNEDAGLPAPKNTLLDLATGRITYYFRSSFTYNGPLEDVTLQVSPVLDDGMVVYLNGQEIYRLGMPAGTINYNTLASRTVGDAIYEGPITVSAAALQSGENVIAVEVHQVASDSSDVVFGMTLDLIPGGSDSATPGSVSSMARPLPAFPDVWLNELQAGNENGPQDNAGDRDPWIELYNSGASVFSLDGYYLSSDYGSPTNWAFPAGTTIPAGGYLMVWCDGEPGETVAGIPHTDFTLSSSAGQVALARMVDDAVQVVDYLTYTNLPPDYSYGDVPDGQPFYRYNLYYPTAGAPNNGSSPPITVSINEWMADNNWTIADPADGDYEDWIELFNPGAATVDLGGYFLTDDLTDPFQYEIPDNGHYTIEPGGFLLVWADGESGQNSTNRPDLHVNFSLSKNGEAIAVYAADGTVIDSVTFGPQAMDVSEGRVPDGGEQIYVIDTPSPRGINEAALAPPAIGDFAFSADGFIFSWPSVVGWQYQVYAKDDLTGGNWMPLSDILSGTGGPLSFTNSTLGSERRYYRVRIEP